MADVVFALTGDVRRNSRALRQIRTLSEHGLTVAVLTHGSGDPSIGVERAQVRWLSRRNSKGPSFFWENHRSVGHIAASIPARAYHASDLYVLPALADAARQHGATLTYDARELYPYVASTVGRPWARIFWRAIERRYIRKADAVITVSEGIAERLVELYGIDSPGIVYNVPPRPPVRSSSRLRIAVGSPSNAVIILHQGQLRPYRGCELLLDAMRDVDTAVLVFLGDGPLKQRLRELSQKSDLERQVFFLDPVPSAELLAYTASADIGVTLLEDICLNHRLALPNKLFEYLSANIPVIASDLPEIRRVVAEHNVGLVVNPANRIHLVEALRQATSSQGVRDHWRRNIPSVFESYNWQESSAEFIRMFRSIL